MFIVGAFAGFVAGVLTAVYAPRFWGFVTARAKRAVDKLADDVSETGTGL